MKKVTLLPTIIGMIVGLNDRVMPNDLIFNEKQKPFFAGRQKRNNRNKIAKQSRKRNRK